jgi:hypothetical protein
MANLLSTPHFKLLPLSMLFASIFMSIFQYFTEDQVYISWQYLVTVGLIFTNVFLYKKSDKLAIVFTGLLWIAFTFNLIQWQLIVSSNVFTIGLGPIKISTPAIDIRAFIQLILYLVIHWKLLKLLFNQALDYIDGKGKKTV